MVEHILDGILAFFAQMRLLVDVEPQLREVSKGLFTANIDAGPDMLA